MALASRSSRRASGRRWLTVGVVLTLLVLLVDASIKSRSPGPTQQLNGSIWADRALALESQSDVQGKQLTAFLTDTKAASGLAVRNQLGSLAAAAHTTYAADARLAPPSDLAAPAGLLQSCLLVRAQESAKIDGAVTAALAAKIGTGVIRGAGATLSTALQRLEVADQACALFAAQLPGWLHLQASPSRWLAPGTVTDPARLTVFLTGLQNRASLTPVSAVSIQAVSTTPSAVGTRKGVQVLAPGRRLTVDVVVGDSGNQPERDLTVTASISPAAGASSAREFVTLLEPGASQAVTIGYLYPPIGREVKLTVTLTPAAGDPAKARTTTLRFEMPSPTSSTPSTTVPASTTTTVAATSGATGAAGTSGVSGTGGGGAGTSGASGTPPST